MCIYIYIHTHTHKFLFSYSAIWQRPASSSSLTHVQLLSVTELSHLVPVQLVVDKSTGAEAWRLSKLRQNAWRQLTSASILKPLQCNPRLKPQATAKPWDEATQFCYCPATTTSYQLPARYVIWPSRCWWWWWWWWWTGRKLTLRYVNIETGGAGISLEENR